MSFPLEPIISITANKGAQLYALSKSYAYVIGGHGSNVAVMPCPQSSRAGDPQVAFCPELNAALIASSEGSIVCYTMTDQSIIWRFEHGSFVRLLLIFPESRAAVISGDKSKVISLDDGVSMESPIESFHSHISTGDGCICAKKAAPNLFYFKTVVSPGILLDVKSTRLRLAYENGNFVLCVFFPWPERIFFIDRRTGLTVHEIYIPDCSLVDTISYDFKGSGFLVLVHSSSSKRLEVWKITVEGHAHLLSRLPEGVGQVGWTFSEWSSHLVSRTGRLVDPRSGVMLKTGWSTAVE